MIPEQQAESRRHSEDSGPWPLRTLGSSGKATMRAVAQIPIQRRAAAANANTRRTRQQEAARSLLPGKWMGTEPARAQMAGETRETASAAGCRNPGVDTR